MPFSARIADITALSADVIVNAANERTDVVFACFAPEVLEAYRRAGVAA